MPLRKDGLTIIKKINKTIGNYERIGFLGITKMHINKNPPTSVNSLTDLYAILTGLILASCSSAELGSASSSSTKVNGL